MAEHKFHGREHQGPVHGHEKHGHVHGPSCNHEAQQPFVREAPKQGRNDPCLCGSGKKHKKCCGLSA